MVLFFKAKEPSQYYVVQKDRELSPAEQAKLQWLFGGAELEPGDVLPGPFLGPRREMLTPWSTNAVEITQNMGISGIRRIEEFHRLQKMDVEYDPMLQAVYPRIDQRIFMIERQPEPIRHIEDIAAYNLEEGLALSGDEIAYLENVSRKMGRPLTDSEVFGFSQVNSEHCRHKIFNGRFIIDGKEMPASLFSLIKKTTTTHPNKVVSAYKDNVAFLSGPRCEQFAPANQEGPAFFLLRDIETALSLKAETHNFPTTVEPFYGASTGSGGEIRDRMAGGKASIPLAGTAVYMTAYPRSASDRSWEKALPPRKWLYQSPLDILIKASNGASDFGNKFGQPLICGSLLTFEHGETARQYGYDKVIMLAGGIGYARAGDSLKGHPARGDRIVLLGGDNYRIGMGGGAVSSVATGEYDSALELNAVQRANPEMQKRVFNTIRAFAEGEENPIVSNHDHGAGGHLNCLSELVEETGGMIHMEKIPIGDPTLSDKEIIGNESQERMGLVLHERDIPVMQRVAERERSPMYVIGEVTGDLNFCFVDKEGGRPMDIKLEYMFGKPPKTVLEDTSQPAAFKPLKYDIARLGAYLEEVLQLEAVACKDWLTNKVDRSVTGKVAKQQTAGPLQLPLNNLGAVALDFRGRNGLATALGHAPVAGLNDSAAGAVLSAAEALTNLVWAPLSAGLQGVSLSANWMWPCRHPGEDARLYRAVEALSDFALALGINIPTGKDSLSMVQKYPDGQLVYSPGTVIVSAAAEVSDVKKIVEPVLQPQAGSRIIFLDFSACPPALGGSSFSQLRGTPGGETPTVADPAYFQRAFGAVQSLLDQQSLLAGHDISAGGMITALLEMCFAEPAVGLSVELDVCEETDTVKLLFNENPGVLLQVAETNLSRVEELLAETGCRFVTLGRINLQRKFTLVHRGRSWQLEIDRLRDLWYRSSWLLDIQQSGESQATARYANYKRQPLPMQLPPAFSGQAAELGIDLQRRSPSGIRAAIIREKGINGDREMAYAMYLAGFDVKDVHMTDLISGRETLDEINFIVFPGGFSNSDVLGSAKGWAGAFRYNEKARESLERFYRREDTLSLGVCNGCQLMVELGLLYPEHEQPPAMVHNDSHKFESAFLSVDVLENTSVMLGSLAGSRLGIWVAHGEGQFRFPYAEERYRIPLKYSYPDYPGNPNGSAFAAAGLCSADGRHLAMMPHLERAVFPWQWGYYPPQRRGDEITPWVEAFVNALRWIEARVAGERSEAGGAG